MSSRYRIVALMSCWLGLALFSTSLSAAEPVLAKLDLALQKSVKDAKTPNLSVIVRMKPGSRAAVRGGLQSHGRVVKAEHPLIDAISVNVPLSALAGLSHNPNVVSISIDAPLIASQTPAPSSNAAILRETLGITSASPQGAGVGVAILDSGIYPSADFGGRITAFYDFTNGGIATAPYDDYGHGTHVAGLIGGTGARSGGVFQGVAPAVNLIGMKVLDSAGVGSVSTVISALEFATTNKSALGIDVINLSLGHPIFESAATDPLVAAVDGAVRAGIVVVVAAGNYGMNPAASLPGYAGIVSPGNAPSAITVGSFNPKKSAIRSDDRIDPFSSRGPSWYDGFVKPDVVAPGRTLAAPAAPGSTLVNDNPSLLVAGTSGSMDYITLTGTSMASAVTSGIVATVISGEPGGRVDGAPGTAAQRLTLASALDTSVASGAWWLLNGIDPQTTIADESNPWSQGFIWNNTVGHGSTVYINSPVWADNILWGDHVAFGDNILWGNNVLWSDDTLWDSIP